MWFSKGLAVSSPLFFLSLFALVIKYRQLDPIEVFIMALYLYFGYCFVIPFIGFSTCLWNYRKFKSLKLGMQHLEAKYKTILLVENINIDEITELLNKYQPEFLLVDRQFLNERFVLVVEIKMNKTRFNLTIIPKCVGTSLYLYTYVKSDNRKSSLADGGHCHRITLHLLNYLHEHCTVTQLLA